MKALEATPKTIRVIFSSNYTIPDFQRPYSWDLEECEQLWSDLYDYYSKLEDQSSEENYFLGTIVVYKKEKSVTDYYVVDGQQRLTTIQLLIKALYDKSTTSHTLKNCLQQKDPISDTYIDKLRLFSEVQSDDYQSFEKIILQRGEIIPSKRFQDNFTFFKNKLDEFWLESNSNPMAMESFISMILDKIRLLPIGCESEDDALTLFDTINNRGLPLSDADILKAKLHKASAITNEKDDFVKRWNDLKKHDWLFRVYMHIIRSKNREIDKEIALRKYFNNRLELLQDWKTVLTTLEKCYDAEENQSIPSDSMAYWEMMRSYPNYYWMFPLFVYLNKYSEYESTNQTLSLNTQNLNVFNDLIIEITRYSIVKGLVYNSVNRIKDDIYKVCSLVQHNENWRDFLKSSISEDLPTFKERLEKSELGRYSRPILLLAALLNSNQNKDDFFVFLKGKFHIEHIAPRVWNNYDGWSIEAHSSLINSLGNLVPFEQKLNISASNSFFSRKQRYYQSSKILDVRELVNERNNWSPEDVLSRKQIVERRIIDFVNLG